MNIIPTYDKHHRALCREWPESLCPDCLQNMLEHQTAEQLRGLEQVDPPAGWRLKARRDNSAQHE